MLENRIRDCQQRVAELHGELGTGGGSGAVARNSSSRRGEGGAGGQSGGALIQEVVASAEQGHLPIIVVPSARGRLSIANAEKFLKEGQFLQPTAGKRPEKLPLGVEKTVAGRPLKFRVYDDTSNFRKFEWKSVVAVIADGKKWQFSGWPFRSEADLFNSIKGFHVKYVDEALDATLAAWNVQILNLKREGRHQDASVAAEFWKSLELFLLKHNPRKFSNDHKL
jgi:hypothetical protein